MYIYLRQDAESTPVRIKVATGAVDLYEHLHQHLGWRVASFAQWWEGLGEEGQAHQKALLEEGSPEALDQTEQNFLAKLEEEAVTPESQA